jgi:sulfofructose kinase
MRSGDSAWPGLVAPEAREVDVVGVGQSSIDHVCLVDGLPEFAGKARMQGYTRLPGGQVATAVLACARLGLRAAFVGAVGDDEAGEIVLAPLRVAGVDVADVAVVAGAPTQLAVILVDRASGERTVIWHRDPRLALAAGRLARERIARGRVLHLDGGDPDAGAWAAKVAREAGAAVVLDADTASPGMAPLLAEVDFPIVSQSFARSYFGTEDVRESLRGLRLAGARMAVVTLGDVGALASVGERLIASPGFRVEARDTTGAGDVFHAAFVWALCAELGPEASLQAANAAAAMNCRALGAQGGLPTRVELEAFLAHERAGAWRGPAPT